MQVGELGPVFALNEPHTVESLRADVLRAAARTPRRCRWLWHRWRTVGTPHYLSPEGGQMHAAALVMLANSNVGSLRRCKRCGTVAFDQGGF